MTLDSSEGGSKSYTCPSSQGAGPTSPLLPREAQETPTTSRSTTPPLKPNIVEGNRWSQLFHREGIWFSYQRLDKIPWIKFTVYLYSVFVYISRYYMYLPLEKKKPCISVMSRWEDRTYRMYNSNMLENIACLFVCSHTSTETRVFWGKLHVSQHSSYWKSHSLFRRRVLPR